jgi:hypothetical protein
VFLFHSTLKFFFAINEVFLVSISRRRCSAPLHLNPRSVGETSLPTKHLACLHQFTTKAVAHYHPPTQLRRPVATTVAPPVATATAIDTKFCLVSLDRDTKFQMARGENHVLRRCPLASFANPISYSSFREKDRFIIVRRPSISGPGPGLGGPPAYFYSVKQLKTAFRVGLGPKKIAGFKISAHARPVRFVGGPGAGRAQNDQV